MRALIVLLAAAASAQTPLKLTLREAESIALKSHPQAAAASLTAQAAQAAVTETRAARFPTLFASATAAGALDNTRLAAGNLNNPIIYNRIAGGITISQILTDFGRTSGLVESSRFRSQAQEQNAQAARDRVTLAVDRAYFAVLRARNVLTVAQQTVSARQLIVDQVTALANSKLKSGLDVSFANVNLSESKLLLVSAQDQLKAAAADLSTGMGFQQPQEFELSEEPLPPPLPTDAGQLVQEALRARPELAGQRAEYNAAQSFAKAEEALNRPTVSALASAGVIPGHEETLHSRYGALGFNVNIPVFNGHLFSARRTEAELRAQAAQQNVRDLENQIARDVQVAWLNANTAFQRLGLTAELLDQATQALDLAQTRYDLGLSSIVELSQAQLAKTSAEIASASARYEYQAQRAALDYQVGARRP